MIRTVPADSLMKTFKFLAYRRAHIRERLILYSRRMHLNELCGVVVVFFVRFVFMTSEKEEGQKYSKTEGRIQMYIV